jgi:hypothetical protein
MLDRLLVRAPALIGVLGAGLRRAPTGSPLRRRAVRLQVTRAFAAMARSDVEVVELFYEPDAEVWMKGMIGVGIQDCYRGREGVRALYADIDEAFGNWSWKIRAIADGGDRLAIRTDFTGYGRTSGVKTELGNSGTAIRLSSRGMAAWQGWFLGRDGWTEALEAVDLSEQGLS